MKRGLAVAAIPQDKVTRVEEGREESSHGTEQAIDLKAEVPEECFFTLFSCENITTV